MRTRLVWLLVLPILLLAGDTALWLWATGRVRAGFDSWVRACAASGWTISYNEPARAGWPFAATLRIGAPRVSPAEGVAWSADWVDLRVGLDQPRTLAIVPGGVQRLIYGSLPDIAATARTLEIDAPLDGTGPATWAVRDARAQAEASVATIGLLTGQAAPDGSATISAEAIALPANLHWVLGPRISSLTVDGRLAGPRSFEVRHLAFGWGPLGGSGSGTMGLDAQNRPSGAMTLDLIGADKALDAAQAQGALSGNVATAVRAVLSVLGQASDAPAGSIKVPIRIRDGLVSAAGVPIARVPAAPGGPSPGP